VKPGRAVDVIGLSYRDAEGGHQRLAPWREAAPREKGAPCGEGEDAGERNEEVRE